MFLYHYFFDKPLVHKLLAELEVLKAELQILL